MDAKGNLYGTTQAGGNPAYQCPANSGCGLAYKVDVSGNETVLYSFTGGPDGGRPVSGLVAAEAADGNLILYGATQVGGQLSCLNGNGAGCGTVFKLTLVE